MTIPPFKPHPWQQAAVDTLKRASTATTVVDAVRFQCYFGGRGGGNNYRNLDGSLTPTGRLKIDLAAYLKQACAAERAEQRMRRTAIADAILAGYRVEEYGDELVMTPDPSLRNVDYTALELRILHLTPDRDDAWFGEVAEFQPEDWDKLQKSDVYRKLYGG